MVGKRLTAAALLIVGLLAGACASTARSNASTSTEACFDAGSVRSYSALNDRYVYVRVRSDEHYLLTLDTIYTGLPFATGISISGDFNWICSNSGAKLTFRDPLGIANARIIEVEKVASREEAQKMADTRLPRKR